MITSDKVGDFPSYNLLSLVVGEYLRRCFRLDSATLSWGSSYFEILIGGRVAITSLAEVGNHVTCSGVDVDAVWTLIGTTGFSGDRLC